MVLADTSSPSSNLLVDDLDISELHQIINEYGGNGYGFQMCPTQLFTEIVNINHVRNQMRKRNGTDISDLQRDAREILHRVYEFSATTWTESNEFLTEESVLIVETYKSAVALYCMSSLSSVGALPPDPLLRSNCEMEGRILYGLLTKCTSRRSPGYMFWPLMILGVQVKDEDTTMRHFVRNHMVSMSASTGTYAPLAAKEVLEKYWASSKDGWDDCFETPQMFTTVLTVNRGQLPRKRS